MAKKQPHPSEGSGPLFLPHELGSNGAPTIAALRRILPISAPGKTDDEVLKLWACMERVVRAFSQMAYSRIESEIEAKTVKKIANRKKNQKAKARRQHLQPCGGITEVE